MSKEDSTSEQRCDECGHEFCNNCRLACCECAHVRRDKVLERYASEAAAEDQNSNNAAKNSSGPRTESPHSAPEWGSAETWLDAALNNQEVPEVAQMYAHIAIAMSLQAIANALRDPFSDGALAVTVDAMPRQGEPRREH